MSKDTIRKWILPFLSQPKRGFDSKFDKLKIIQLIFSWLKTGCQWRQIPLKSVFHKEKISWKSFYHHFQKWSKDGSFKRVWVNILVQNRMKLDFSCIQIDGSYTRTRGGQSAGYQARKKAFTTNSIFLADNQGRMIWMSEPMAGNHNDLFEIEKNFGEILDFLQEIDLETKGLFLNADAGFDSEKFRDFLEKREIIGNIKTNPRNGKNEQKEHIFDEKLYKNRFKIERANAWLDSFKALIIRYETLNINWLSLHILAFSILFLKNLKV